MNIAQFERQNHTILDVATGQRQPHASINAAKRWSREKQMSLDGALGRGSVRVAI